MVPLIHTETSLTISNIHKPMKHLKFHSSFYVFLLEYSSDECFGGAIYFRGDALRCESCHVIV